MNTHTQAVTPKKSVSDSYSPQQKSIAPKGIHHAQLEFMQLLDLSLDGQQPQRQSGFNPVNTSKVSQFSQVQSQWLAANIAQQLNATSAAQAIKFSIALPSGAIVAVQAGQENKRWKIRMATEDKKLEAKLKESKGAMSAILTHELGEGTQLDIIEKRR